MFFCPLLYITLILRAKTNSIASNCDPPLEIKRENTISLLQQSRPQLFTALFTTHGGMHLKAQLPRYSEFKTKNRSVTVVATYKQNKPHQWLHATITTKTTQIPRAVLTNLPIDKTFLGMFGNVLNITPSSSLFFLRKIGRMWIVQQKSCQNKS